MQGLAIPLAALRPDLDDGWPAGARWQANGVDARASLEQSVGSRLSFPLRRVSGTRLRTRVALLDPSGRRCAVRLRVEMWLPSGERHSVWKGTLVQLGGRRFPASRAIVASLGEAAEADLVLAASGPAGKRVLWAEPAIESAGASEEPDCHEAPPAREDRPRPPGPGVQLLSILTPVHDPPPEILEETLASVLAQTYEHWELCLVDDGSRDPRVREILRRHADEDSRIHTVRREEAGGIASATNAALALAGGDYIALLDHDDVLVPDALAQVADALAERPETDVLYSDEEVFEGDKLRQTYLKPGWSPDLLRSQMYTCHLGVYRRSLAEEVGGFRPEFDGSQDFDFALRATERTERIVHIPRVLYRWRAHAASAAGNAQAKPSAYPAARRAIAEHLRRTGVDAEVHFGAWQGIYRVVHRVDPALRVGVAVAVDRPSPDLGGLLASVTDAASSGLEPERVVVAGRGNAVAGAGAPAVVVETDPGSDWGAILERGARACEDADVIVLLAGPVEPLTRRWLARLVGFATQPGVGAVGAKVLAPDGRVEQAGLVVSEGVPLPIMHGAAPADPGPLGLAILPCNASAVSGILATRGEVFRELGGLDGALGDLAIVDYCLRARGRGLRAVFAADAIVRRPATARPLNDLAALEIFRRRWRGSFTADPYFELSRGWPGVEVAVGSG